MSTQRIPDTTIILVAYHGDRWIPACVDSLRESARAIRLVLLDNAGNTCIDGLDLNAFDHVVLRAPRPLGFAEANNYALQQAGLGTDFVCFLNQDTVGTRDWIVACVDVLRAEPEIGAVSPLLFAADGASWDEGFWDCAGKAGVREALVCGTDIESWYEVQLITAAAMIVRSDLLREVGPFDPIFGSYYEDYDLCWRIREAGSKIAVCTHARVNHFSGSATTTPEARRRRIRLIVRNRAIHRIRSAGPQRLRTVAKYLAHDVPYNLGRSLVRTSSAQPLREYCAAHCDLLRIAGRLLSERQDRTAWLRYLESVGWRGQSADETMIAPVAASR